MKRLSLAQIAMMDRLARLSPEPEESPGGGCGCQGKTLASAWHRTANSLKNLGLVHVSRFGDHYCAGLTAAGWSWRLENSPADAVPS